MSPISASAVAPLASPFPSINVQSSAFQDFLSEAATVDGKQSIIHPADASSKAVPVADIPVALAGVRETPQAVPIDISNVGVPSADSEPTANLREALEASLSLAPAPLASIQTEPADNPETVDAECDLGDKAEGPTPPAHAAAPPPLVPQIPAAVATIVPNKIVDSLRAASRQGTSGTAPIDARPTGRQQAANTSSAHTAAKDPLPDILEALPASQPETGSSGASVIDARSSMASAVSVPVVQLASDQPIAELKQLILRQDGEWIGALARDIVANASRDNQLQFTLKPENLGVLDVAITSDNGQIDIRLETSTAAAAQVISADQARLIEDLRGAGLKLGQFEMTNRQNGNDQQRRPARDQQNSDPASPTTQPKALSRALGRFA